MKKKVAIIAAAQTEYGIHEHLTHPEMVYYLINKMLKENKITIEDIDTICDAGNDLLDGKAISHTEVVGAAGGYMKEEVKTEEDGSMAAFYAVIRILSGYYDTALVFGYSKCSGVGLNEYSSCLFEPILLRPMGLNEITSLALQARRYVERYSIDEEQAARVVVKNHQHALANPLIKEKRNTRVNDVINSNRLSSPIKELDIPPVTDGACALVLASEEKVQELRADPVWIAGIGNSVDSYDLGHRDLSTCLSARIAARKAYKMAGISNPMGELDIAEITEPSSFHELILYESLEFCENGKGGKMIDEGLTRRDGRLPVNTSGGALSANPLVAVGLSRITEAYLQLSGKAGRRQIPGAKVALAHGTSGVCLQSNTVFILKK